MEDRQLADRHLFIISRDQPGLWEYLRREFSSEANVEVVLDRRRGRDRRSGGERRAVPRVAEAGLSDRRALERRMRAFADTQLRSVGYVMLRVH
ncbi:MAG: hypothetical protein DMD98_01810 [Candidatus Rokuibacteriota bacterium]|jgi:hypothetical protein|nr:MAG: hypothetical protein DMD98_01810 [Candidatus Rokubacteria bacterium]